ncbi:aminotransferase class I/II-fold pyridoxal phosphate-dependent enzyme [Mariniflexile sp.]|uniref:aminotransferase class I/II-fold pyridoxal phosphate-dependent enzyme n=1 Tax=Mariniflexile sp. TaxID=1979402 RepID=UPI0035683F12
MIIESFPDREITVEGKSFLYFGGTAYLGLSTHAEFQNNLITGIKKWGTCYGSSRNANIKLSIFKKAEEAFANLIGTETALTCSSGTFAGKLVLECLSKSVNAFYHYPKTHPAILYQKSLPVFVDGKVHPNLLNNTPETVVIAADAFLGLEVEPTPFDFLSSISPQKQIILLLDESHSLGIVGNHLEGVFNSIPNKVVNQKIMVSSLGKALGMAGGIIAGDAGFINVLRNEPDFISSSSISPAYLEAFMVSQDIIKNQRGKLEFNLEFLFEGLKLKPIFKFNKKYPVIYCEDDTIFKKFFHQGIIIANFKYPTYKAAMNRIVITANHTKTDLNKLKEVLLSF